MSRIILSILRQAIEPLTTRDIALQLLVERALDKSDQRLLRLMTKRVGVALRGQRENGVVRADQGPGQYMLWEITAVPSRGSGIGLPRALRLQDIGSVHMLNQFSRYRPQFCSD